MFRIEQYDLGWVVLYRGYCGRSNIICLTGIKSITKIFKKHGAFKGSFPSKEAAQATIDEIESKMIMKKLLE